MPCKALEAQSLGGAGAKSGKGDGQPAGWLQRIVSGLFRPAEKRLDATPNPKPHGGMGEKMQWLKARLLITTGLANAIGRRQANYIGRMMEMFERGDLQEALRHALAMGELEGKPKPPSLGVPIPRHDLTIS